MTEKVQPLLAPGERLEFAMTAQTGLNPAWRWLTSWLVIANKARIVAITDQRIAVFKAGNWTRRTPKQLLYSAPRQTELPHKRGPWSKVDLGQERVWLPRPAYKFLDAANAEVAAGVVAAPVFAQPQFAPQPQPVGVAVGAPVPAAAPPAAAPAAAPVAAATASAAPAAGGWHPDPTGRHQLRWWDSAAWTANVSDDGVTAVDPIG